MEDSESEAVVDEASSGAAWMPETGFQGELPRLDGPKDYDGAKALEQKLNDDDPRWRDNFIVVMYPDDYSGHIPLASNEELEFLRKKQTCLHIMEPPPCSESNGSTDSDYAAAVKRHESWFARGHYRRGAKANPRLAYEYIKRRTALEKGLAYGCKWIFVIQSQAFQCKNVGLAIYLTSTLR